MCGRPCPRAAGARLTRVALARSLAPAAGTSASGGERAQTAHSILQLELSGGSGAADAEAAPENGGSSSRLVHMRLGKEEMVDLLSKLDMIQGQMDRLS